MDKYQDIMFLQSKQGSSVHLMFDFQIICHLNPVIAINHQFSI